MLACITPLTYLKMLISLLVFANVRHQHIIEYCIFFFQERAAIQRSADMTNLVIRSRPNIVFHLFPFIALGMLHLIMEGMFIKVRA